MNVYMKLCSIRVRMTALLEYILTAILEYIDLLNNFFRGLIFPPAHPLLKEESKFMLQ